MEYIPYLYRQTYWPNKIIYNKYHDIHYAKGDKFEKLITAKDDQIIVQGMWRMQILGQIYEGINVICYDDKTNWEFYDEVIGQLNTKEQREEFHSQNYDPDSYDDYFEDLAKVAVEIGCERAEIKCLIKSLLLKYRFARIEDYGHLPHKEFSQLYLRLISSKDIDQLNAAKRLSRYHIKKLTEFIEYDLRKLGIRDF